MQRYWTLHGQPPRLLLRSYSCKLTKRRSTMKPSGAVVGQSTRISLSTVDLSPGAFSPFGQVVGPTDDGKQFDQEDAQLILDNGTPRFYIMRIPRRGLQFDRITYHAKVTQCLGSLGPQPWYLTVAKPTFSVKDYPKTEDLVAFRIPPGVFVKLEAGTWHAGPLFDSADHMDFYNLELSDTNVVDHNTHDYKEEGVTFVIQNK